MQENPSNGSRKTYILNRKRKKSLKKKITKNSHSHRNPSLQPLIETTEYNTRQYIPCKDEKFVNFILIFLEKKSTFNQGIKGRTNIHLSLHCIGEPEIGNIDWEFDIF